VRRASAALALAAFVLACSSPPPPEDPGPSHPGEAWWSWRAQQLGIAPGAARERDAALSTAEPPNALWGPALRREAAALWRDRCASCHGPRGRLQGVPPPGQGPPPRAFGGMGLAMGFLFGGDAMRAGFYRRIATATDAEGSSTTMPAFGGTLSHEQIWALVFFIEEL